MFIKQDTYAFQTLRNWFFSMCGLSEIDNAREIQAFLAQSPHALADALVAIARDPETHAGFKGRTVAARVTSKVGKKGFPFARASFAPHKG